MYNKNLIIGERFVLCEPNVAHCCPCYLTEYQENYVPKPILGRPIDEKFLNTYGMGERCKKILSKRPVLRNQNECPDPCIGNRRKPLPCACEVDPGSTSNCRDNFKSCVYLKNDKMNSMSCEDFAKVYIKQRRGIENTIKAISRPPDCDNNQKKCKCDDEEVIIKCGKLPSLELRNNQPNQDFYQLHHDFVRSCNLTDFVGLELRNEVPEPDFLCGKRIDCEALSRRRLRGNKPCTCPPERRRPKKVVATPLPYSICPTSTVKPC